MRHSFPGRTGPDTVSDPGRQQQVSTARRLLPSSEHPGPGRSTRAVWSVLAFGSAMLLCIGRSLSDDDLSRYYAGLRERGLYRLAESDCLRRLAEERISPGLRAELAIELSRTYAEHAGYRTGEEREELWKRARSAIDSVLENEPADAYRELLLAQRAFVDARQGAQLQWHVDLFPLDQATRTNAAELLRSALTQLMPLPEAFDARMRTTLAEPAPMRRRPDHPPPSRYREGRRHVEFRAAIALVHLAKVLSTGPDRAEALHQADQLLRGLANNPKPDEIAWHSDVLLIEVQRLNGNNDRVEPLVTSLIGKGPPEAIRDAAIAQWVRADLDSGRIDSAIARLQTHRREHGTKSAELTALVVETLLKARQVAVEKQEHDLAKNLLAEAQLLAADLSGPWGIRSRMLIEFAKESDTYGLKLAESVHRARWAWQNGNLEEAITAYHDAVTEAHRSGKSEFAVDLAITLATLQAEAHRYEGAIVTLTGLLDNYPETIQAADADLLRAYALGRQYEQHPDDERREAYRLALADHQRTYSESPTVHEATWMLARLEEHERHWPEAVALLESIPPESDRGTDAEARLAVVYEKGLTDLTQRGEPTEVWEQRAIAALKNATDRFPPPDQPLPEAQIEIAWRLARLLLRQSEPDFALADLLLARVLTENNHNNEDREASSAAGPDPERLAMASQLRIVSLAGQGRLKEARQVVSELEQEPADRLLDVLSGLTTAAAQVSIEHKRTVGTLQLEVAQSLEAQREQLSEDQQLKLDESLAQAFAALNQVPQAAAVYEKILWQQPNNARIIDALARLYESSGSLSDIRNANRQWQALERLQRKGTAEWLETRYHLAWCSHRLGNNDTARKLIGVTRVLYPELGSPKLKTRFDALENSLRAGNLQK